MKRVMNVDEATQKGKLKSFGSKSGNDGAGGVCMKPIAERAAVCIMIKRLLKVDRRKRLGCGKNGIEEVKTDRFFGTAMDWTAMLEEQCIPPWIPKVAGEEDTRHFRPITKPPDQDTGDEVEGEAVKLFKKIALGEKTLPLARE